MQWWKCAEKMQIEHFYLTNYLVRYCHKQKEEKQNGRNNNNLNNKDLYVIKTYRSYHM